MNPHRGFLPPSSHWAAEDQNLFGGMVRLWNILSTSLANSECLIYYSLITADTYEHLYPLIFRVNIVLENGLPTWKLNALFLLAVNNFSVWCIINAKVASENILFSADVHRDTI